MATELVDYFVRHYTLVLDNEQGSYNEALRVTREAILEETPDVTRDAYRAMTEDQRNIEYAPYIGAKILALIEEWTGEIIDEHDGIGAQLLNAVRITSGHDIGWELGVHYMPDRDYVDFLPEDDDEDEA